MKRRLTILALSALILVPAIGRANDSIGEKAESVVRGIGRGIRDAAREFRQAAVGQDVEVSLGERHMEMAAHVEAGDITFTVTNIGTEERGFKISGPGLERYFTSPLPPGETKEMTVNLEPGVYQVEAPVPGDPTKQLAVELTAVAQ